MNPSPRMKARDRREDRGRSSEPPGTPLPAMVPEGVFPLVDRERRAGRAYLDSAATTQKPRAVLDRVRRFYEEENAAVNRAVHRLGTAATNAYEAARIRVGRFIGAERPEEEIVFCRGATEALNLAALAWGTKHLRPGDEIVVSTLEHHSNLVPWQFAAARTGARLVPFPFDGAGVLRPERLAGLVGPRTRVVAVTHVSNVLGTVTPVAALAEITRATGALLVVDGAQATGHLPVDVRALGCDLYAGSGHKMFGPSGIGFLYGRAEVLRTFGYYQGGGGMIEEVFMERFTAAPPPRGLEAGTPPAAGAVGLAAAAAFLEWTGMERVAAHERALTARVMEGLEARPWVEVYGPRDPAERSGLVSFNVRGVHAHDTAGALDAAGVAVRAGHLCAQPLLRRLGIPACARASFSVYNDGADVDRLLDGLDRCARFFGVA